MEKSMNWNSENLYGPNVVLPVDYVILGKRYKSSLPVKSANK